MKSSKVSVIIPTYNRAHYLPATIESVLQQTFQDFEIIIVDDGSTDNTQEVLKPYLERSPNKIRYYYKENRGCASARNHGLEKANGKYIAFLDSDDLFELRKLEIQVGMLDQHPEIGFVYSDAYAFDETTKTQFISRAVRPDKNSSIVFDLFMTTLLAPGAPLFRRECFREDRYDEHLKYNEDTDLFLRIAYKFKALHSDYVSTNQRLHPNRKSNDKGKLMEALLYSSKKFLKEFPDFEKQYSKIAKKRIADIRCDLALACMESQKYADAIKNLQIANALNPRISFRLFANLLTLNRFHQVTVPIILIYANISKKIKSLVWFLNRGTVGTQPLKK